MLCCRVRCCPHAVVGTAAAAVMLGCSCSTLCQASLRGSSAPCLLDTIASLASALGARHGAPAYVRTRCERTSWHLSWQRRSAGRRGVSASSRSGHCLLQIFPRHHDRPCRNFRKGNTHIYVYYPLQSKSWSWCKPASSSPNRRDIYRCAAYNCPAQPSPEQHSVYHP